MPTDSLLDDLVSQLKPVRRRNASREGLLLLLLGAVELGLFLLLGAARPDIMLAVELPSFWWKILSLGLLAIGGVVAAVRSFEPSRSPRPGLKWLAVVVAVSLVAGWVIDAASAGGEAFWARLMWRHGIDCVVAMVVLSIPAILTLGLLMRRGASTDPTGSALAVGVASAAWGAFVFVFNCPHDDPFYIAVWYLVGCSIVAVIGRVTLPLITRW
jgi:hypothetical protein